MCMMRVVVCLVSIVLSSSCGKPELTNRYQSAAFPTPTSEDSAPRASITVFTLAISDPPASTTIASLSDRGQAEAVKALAAKEQMTKGFLSALATPISPAESPAHFIDRTKVKRRIVISLQNTSLGRADRVAEATIQLRPDANAHFLSWDKFKTAYEDVDLGKLALTQTSGLTGGLEFGPLQSTSIAGANLEASYERNLNEEIALRQRIVTSTGALSPEKAEFYQQGAVGIDLTGNVIIDVYIDIVDDSPPLETYAFTNLVDASGKPNPPGNVMARTQLVVYPNKAKAPVMMDATLGYVVRHVVSGDKSVAEGDDRVHYLRGEVSTAAPNILVPIDDMRFAAWGLVANGNFVKIREAGVQREGVLALSSYEEAAQLLAWLKKIQEAGAPSDADVTVAGRQLIVGSTPLKPSGIRQVDVAILTQNF
jgi:hypothetical protein